MSIEFEYSTGKEKFRSNDKAVTIKRLTWIDSMENLANIYRIRFVKSVTTKHQTISFILMRLISKLVDELLIFSGE